MTMVAMRMTVRVGMTVRMLVVMRMVVHLVPFYAKGAASVLDMLRKGDKRDGRDWL